MTTEDYIHFILGVVVGIIFSTIAWSSASVFESVVVKHKNCAYFHPITKKLIWKDDADKSNTQR